jgi:hypothetical protein
MLLAASDQLLALIGELLAGSSTVTREMRGVRGSVQDTTCEP